MPGNATIEKPILFRPNSFWRFIDILFPPFCCFCGKIGYEICPDCFSKIDLTKNYHICVTCGRVHEIDHACPICKKTTPAFDQARAWGVYAGPLKEILLKIKYKRCFGLVEYIAKPMVDCIQTWGIIVDMIIPVPLGKQREKARGYNQSVLIAEPISKHFDIPIESHALSRIRETKTQVGLNFVERNKNIKNAFSADRSIVNEKSILLIDDISTTCATLNESARTLKLSGANEIFCFTVAQTKNQKD